MSFRRTRVQAISQRISCGPAMAAPNIKLKDAEAKIKELKGEAQELQPGRRLQRFTEFLVFAIGNLNLQTAAGAVSAARSELNSFSSFATTTVATPLPITFASARAIDKKLSTANTSASPSSGRIPDAPTVVASTIKAAPVTPAAPFEVTSIMATKAKRRLKASGTGQT